MRWRTHTHALLHIYNIKYIFLAVSQMLLTWESNEKLPSMVPLVLQSSSMPKLATLLYIAKLCISVCHEIRSCYSSKLSSLLCSLVFCIAVLLNQAELTNIIVCHQHRCESQHYVCQLHVQGTGYKGRIIEALNRTFQDIIFWALKNLHLC